MIKKFIPGGLAFLVPFAALAQSNLGSVLTKIQTLLNQLIPILVTLTIIYFFWGLAQYVLNSGSEEAKEEGKNKMIWGIVAIFVMLSIWGIVGLIGNTFGITPGQSGANLIPRVQ